MRASCTGSAISPCGDCVGMAVLKDERSECVVFVGCLSVDLVSRMMGESALLVTDSFDEIWATEIIQDATNVTLGQ
jgi:hypothetical protein